MRYKHFPLSGALNSGLYAVYSFAPSVKDVDRLDPS